MSSLKLNCRPITTSMLSCGRILIQKQISIPPLFTREESRRHPTQATKATDKSRIRIKVTLTLKKIKRLVSIGCLKDVITGVSSKHSKVKWSSELTERLGIASKLQTQSHRDKATRLCSMDSSRITNVMLQSFTR